MTESLRSPLRPGELNPLFSDIAIPYTGHRDLGRCKWFGGDSEKNYQSNPHPLFGPDDIEYSFNRHGYRCLNFEERNRFDKNHLHLLIVGESHALGVGLSENQTYAYLVAQKLAAHTGRPVQHWNLSQAGASAEYLSRLLRSALAVLRPDFVILNFGGWGRREYIFEDGNCLTCGDGVSVAGSIYTADRHDSIRKTHFELAHESSDIFSRWKNVIACQRHLKMHNVMWVFKAISHGPESLHKYIEKGNLAPRRIQDLRDDKTYIDTPELRFARDIKHAGVGPHADIANDIYGLFVQRYAL